MALDFSGAFPVHSPEDKLLRELLKAQVLDKDLNVRSDRLSNGSSPCLTGQQIVNLTSILQTPVEIIANYRLPAWKVLRKMQKLVEQWKISPQDYLTCVGSAHAGVIEADPQYGQLLIEGLAGRRIDGWPAKGAADRAIKDLDIRVHLPETDAGKNLKLKAQFIAWLVDKVCAELPGELKGRNRNHVFEMISSRINQKFCNPYDSPDVKPDGNRFMLISLGDKEFTLDIVLAQHLRRTQILSPDGGEIPFNIVRLPKGESRVCPIALTHLPYDQIASKKYETADPARIVPGPKPAHVFKVILDRTLKIVHFPDIDTLDHNGWFKLSQYFARGYRSCDEERLLFDKVSAWAMGIEDGTKKSLATKLADKLCDFVKKHYANEPAASLCYYLNALLSLYRVGRADLIPEVLQGLQPALVCTDGLDEPLLWIVTFLKSNPQRIELLIDLLQCAAVIHLNLASNDAIPDQIKPFITFNSRKPAIRMDISDKHKKRHTLMLPLDPEPAVQRLFKQTYNGNEMDLAVQLWDLLLNNRAYKGKSSSIAYVYLEWMKFKPENFQSLIREAMVSGHPFLRKFGEHIFQLARIYEDYQQTSLSSPCSLEQAWESLETHASLGFKPEQYEIYRPYMQKLFMATVTRQGVEDHALLWDMLKIKRWLNEHPWIYQENPIEKYQLLKTAIDRIIEAKPASKMGLSDLLFGFFVLLIAEYSESPDESKAADMAGKMVQLSGLVNAASPQWKDRINRLLSEITPRLIVSLHTQHKGAAILELRKCLRLIQAPHTPDTMLAVAEALSTTGSSGGLSEEMLKDFNEILQKLDEIFPKLEPSQKKALSDCLQILFVRLLEKEDEQNAWQLLQALERIIPDAHFACCCKYLRYAGQIMSIRKDLPKCYMLLSSEKWNAARAACLDDTRLLAEATVKAALDGGCKAIDPAKVFSLFRLYGLKNAQLWKAFMNAMSFVKEKRVLADVWNHFLDDVLKSAPGDDAEHFVQSWIKGIKACERLMPAGLRQLDRYYEAIKPHLQNCAGKEVADEARVIVLQAISHSSDSLDNAENVRALFQEIVQQNQTAPPKYFCREIDLAIVMALSLSSRPEFLRESVERLLRFLTRYPDSKTEPGVSKILEMLFLKAEKFHFTENDSVLAIYCTLVEQTCAEINTIDWERVIAAFIRQGSHPLLGNALNLLCKLVVGNTPNGKIPKKIPCPKIDIDPRLILSMLEKLSDEGHPLCRETRVETVLSIFKHPSIMKLLKGEDTTALWIANLKRKMAGISKIEDLEKSYEEMVLLINVMSSTAEEVTHDAGLQAMVADILEGFLKRDFAKALFCETLFLHCALGKHNNLDEYPFKEAPGFFKSARPSAKLLMVNSRSPYFHSKKWADAMLNFECIWLKRLTDKLSRMDLVNSEEAYPYLNYIEMRLMMIITAQNLKGDSIRRLRECIDSYIKTLMILPKSRNLEIDFLNHTLDAFCHRQEALYKDNKNKYNFYWLYYAIHALCQPEGLTVRSTREYTLETTVKVNVIQDVHHLMMEAEGGFDACHAFALLHKFLHEKVLGNNFDAIGEVLKPVMVYIWEHPGRLKQGQTIEQVLSAMNGPIEVILQSCQKALADNPSSHQREAAVQLMQAIADGLLTISNVYHPARQEAFHPLTSYLHYLKLARPIVFQAGNSTAQGFLDCLHRRGVPEVLDEIKWCVDHGYIKMAQVLQMRLLFIAITKDQTVSDSGKRELGHVIRDYIKMLPALFPEGTPQYESVVNLGAQMIALARQNKVFDIFDAEEIDGLLSNSLPSK